MGLIEIFAIALGLSADAFAVSICKGLSVQKLCPRHSIITGFYFGLFQMLMPIIGFILGSKFNHLIEFIDHWIAFVLLGIIGFNMIKESREEAKEMNCSFSFSDMIPLAVATSIDALTMGITFSVMKVDIVISSALIGITTFTLSAFGVYIGNKFGGRFKSKAELFGGLILVAMGIKILIEHTLI